MERRAFVEKLISALVLGSFLFLGGCSKSKEPARFGNQEKLWQMTAGGTKLEEPIDLAYSKETPALYRDSSMGKADPNFVPKVSGG